MPSRHPANRLRNLIDFFETHNIATYQQICELLNVNNYHSIRSFVNHHWIAHIQHDQYRLHPDVLQLIHAEIPGGYLRRDKQLFVHMDERVDIRASLKEKLYIWAKQQNLLLEDIQIHSNNTYTLKFHPGRYNRLDNKVLFDISKGFSEGQMLGRAASVEGAGAWELGSYYRQLAGNRTQFSESALRQVMKAVYTEQGRSLRISQISAEDFRLASSSLNREQTMAFDGFRWDNERKTLALDFIEDDWQRYKQKFEDALVTIRQNPNRQGVFNRIASITLKRVLPGVGLGLVITNVAHAEDHEQALVEETTSWLGVSLGMAAGTAVAGVVCGASAPLCAATIIAGGALFGVEAMQPFNEVFAIGRANLEEWTSIEVAEEHIEHQQAAAVERQRQTEQTEAAERQRQVEQAVIVERQRQAQQAAVAAAQQRQAQQQAAAAERQRQAEQIAAVERQRQAEQAAASERQRQAERSAAQQRQRQAKLAAEKQRLKSLTPQERCYQSALDEAKKLTGADKHFQLARAAFYKKRNPGSESMRFEEASKECDKALALDPKHADAFKFQLSIGETNLTSNSQKYYRSALIAAKNLAGADKHFQLARVELFKPRRTCDQWKKYEEASKACNQALKLNPRHMGAFQLKSNVAKNNSSNNSNYNGNNSRNGGGGNGSGNHSCFFNNSGSSNNRSGDYEPLDLGTAHPRGGYNGW